MPLSPEMQQRYTSEVDIDFWDALILHHPAAGWLYMTNAQTNQQATFNGATETFAAIPFEVVLPKLDGQGQQDMQIIVCNVAEEMAAALDKVKTQPEEPVKAYFTQYIHGNYAPQYDPPLELTLSDIELTHEVFRGTATRVDVFNQQFPKRLYRGDLFPALIRR